MAKTLSSMLSLGTKAPQFELPDPAGNMISLADVATDRGLLVIFMCNHCPYVKHVRAGMAQMTSDFIDKGLGVVGINSNDIENYPEDSPEMMAKEIKQAGYRFPYLFDESQEVARTYQAACTPDFFLFDHELALVYRGQMDDSRPGNDQPVTGETLRQAVEQMFNGEPLTVQQKPSMGCNIKWKAA